MKYSNKIAGVIGVVLGLALSYHTQDHTIYYWTSFGIVVVLTIFALVRF